MTIGIGGWGSRRKPMALVRAILRSDLTDLHDRVATAGPTSACCRRRAGPPGGLPASSRWTRSRSSRTSGRPARPGTVELTELDEGMLHWGLHAAAHRLPFLPIAGRASAPTCCAVNPELRTVRSPYADGEELVAMPALRLDAALVHLNRADAARQRPVPRPRPVLRRPVLPGGRARLRVLRADRAHRGAARGRAAAEPADQPGHGGRRGRDPERRALHQLRARLRPRRDVPGAVRRGRRRPRTAGSEFRGEYLSGDEAGYQQAVRQFAQSQSARASRAEPVRRRARRRQAGAGADAAGRPGRDLRGGVRRGLARRRRDPGQPDGR